MKFCNRGRILDIYSQGLLKGVYVQNEGLKPPSSSSSTNTPRWYLPLHVKAQIRPAVLL